jgi:hypothetical protein
MESRIQPLGEFSCDKDPGSKESCQATKRKDRSTCSGSKGAWQAANRKDQSTCSGLHTMLRPMRLQVGGDQNILEAVKGRFQNNEL